MLVRLVLLGLVSGIRTNSQMKEFPPYTKAPQLVFILLHNFTQWYFYLFIDISLDCQTLDALSALDIRHQVLA